MEYQLVSIPHMKGIPDHLRLDIFIEGKSLYLEFGQHNSRKEADGGFCGKGIYLDISSLPCLAKFMRDLIGANRFYLTGELSTKNTRQNHLFGEREQPSLQDEPGKVLPVKALDSAPTRMGRGGRLIRVDEAAVKLGEPLWAIHSKIFIHKVPTISTPALPFRFIDIRELEKLYGAEKIQSLLEEED